MFLLIVLIFWKLFALSILRSDIYIFFFVWFNLPQSSKNSAIYLQQSITIILIYVFGRKKIVKVNKIYFPRPWWISPIIPKLVWMNASNPTALWPHANIPINKKQTCPKTRNSTVITLFPHESLSTMIYALYVFHVQEEI